MKLERGTLSLAQLSTVPCLSARSRKVWRAMELGAQLEQAKQKASCHPQLSTLPLMRGSDQVLSMINL
jgi:hypothetical protein